MGEQPTNPSLELMLNFVASRFLGVNVNGAQQDYGCTQATRFIDNQHGQVKLIASLQELIALTSRRGESVVGALTLESQGNFPRCCLGTSR